MKYELVLQWPGSSIDDYDLLISIENFLVENLPADCTVDGHDTGDGQANIFIRTDAPEKTSRDVQTFLKRIDAWADVRIAYRNLERHEYTAIWPKNLKTFRVS